MPAFVRRAWKSGGMGYVLKTAGVARLRAAIEAVGAGRSAFPSRDLAAEWPSKAIAACLVVSPRAVEGRLDRLFDRYGIADRTRLATFALEQGWVTPGQIGSGGLNPKGVELRCLPEAARS